VARLPKVPSACQDTGSASATALLDEGLRQLLRLRANFLLDARRGRFAADPLGRRSQPGRPHVHVLRPGFS
jgi:hypothetical protein